MNAIAMDADAQVDGVRPVRYGRLSTGDLYLDRENEVQEYAGPVQGVPDYGVVVEISGEAAERFARSQECRERRASVYSRRHDRFF